LAQIALSPLETSKPRWLVSGDFDGMFGLFFSGLPDLLLLVGLGIVCGLPPSLMVTRILPGVAVSVLFGNLFYSWQAYRLAKQTGRNDVTAVPFGVNAPTIFAYIFLVMAPVFRATHDASLTWQVGIFACFLSGIIQVLGAFCTDWLRRTTPRAALLCPLAGIALTFLCLNFIFGVFQSPLIGIVPMAVLFALYASRMPLPLRIPAPAIALAVGATIMLAVHRFHVNIPADAIPPRVYLPHFVNVFELFSHREAWSYLSIILPMSMLDTMVSLQILESVKLAGDDYKTRPSLLVNGIATLAAASFGSPFPTILYFGHMSHKRNGARIGYSAMSGLLTFLLCITGLLPYLLYIVPLEVASAVIIWFGLMTVGQAFSEVDAENAIAVALGLVPLIAQWAMQLVETTVRVCGASLASVASLFGSDLPIYGLIALSQGALLTSMIWAATLSCLFSSRFMAASAWLAAGAILSWVGLIHGFQMTSQGVEAHIGFGAGPVFAAVYTAAAGCMLACHYYSRRLGREDATEGLDCGRITERVQG
jgi:adenine/guanine/hypoxanthine permease